VLVCATIQDEVFNKNDPLPNAVSNESLDSNQRTKIKIVREKKYAVRKTNVNKIRGVHGSAQSILLGPKSAG